MNNPKLKKKIQSLDVQSNTFLFVKVGSDSRPATQDDVDQVRDDFKTCLKEKFPDLPLIVAHHGVSIELIRV